MNKISSLFISYLVFIVSFNACSNNRPPDKINTMETELKYLALGDSYTIGESVTEIERWPVQLADRLRQDGISIGDPDIIARTGWTTDELINGIADRKVSGTYDLVSLLIGVNNQYRGRDSENFREEFKELLIQALVFAANDTSNVFVLSIPDWGVMPFAEGRDREKISSEIDEYNNVCREECEIMGIAFINITPISREAAYKPEYVADDGLHPSGEMYTEWVGLFYSNVNELLSKE